MGRVIVSCSRKGLPFRGVLSGYHGILLIWGAYSQGLFRLACYNYPTYVWHVHGTVIAGQTRGYCRGTQERKKKR